MDNYHEKYFSATDYFLLPTNHTNLHESRALHFNGDLYGRTNRTNKIIELVKIRATEQVAIKTH